MLLTFVPSTCKGFNELPIDRDDPFTRFLTGMRLQRYAPGIQKLVRRKFGPRARLDELVVCCDPTSLSQQSIVVDVISINQAYEALEHEAMVPSERANASAKIANLTDVAGVCSDGIWRAAPPADSSHGGPAVVLRISDGRSIRFSIVPSPLVFGMQRLSPSTRVPGGSKSKLTARDIEGNIMAEQRSDVVEVLNRLAPLPTNRWMAVSGKSRSRKEVHLLDRIEEIMEEIL